jgi:hypothetical protein
MKKGCGVCGVEADLKVRLYVTGRGDLQWTVESQVAFAWYQSLATMDHMI